MADKSNAVSLSHAAAVKKGPTPASVVAPLRRSKRKRIPHGELPTNSDASPVLARPSPDPRTRSRARMEHTSNIPTRPPTAIGTAAATDVHGDPQLVAHFPSKIYTYLHSQEIEPKRRPLANYIEEVQTDFTVNMRGIMVNWLVDVAEVYKFASDTLYLTISYIDRFLSFKVLNWEKIWLLGVSAMLVASKYEEISPLHVEDVCCITENSYTKGEIVQMERDILKYLNFEMGNPTVKTFLW